MDEDLDVTIEVVFPGKRYFSAESISTALDLISRAIYEVEEEELGELFEEFQELPEVVRDGMRFRFDRIGPGRALNVQFGEKGSLILCGFAGGMAVWILSQTLGETIKEVWLESEGHRRLKALLARNVFGKQRKIASAINRSWLRGRGVEDVRAMISDEQHGRIRVEVITDPSLLIPPPSEIVANQPPAGESGDNHEDR